MTGAGAPTTSALAPMDIGGRIGRLRERLDDAGCDAVLITNLTNVRYLTGFTGSAGLLLITGDRAILATDGRYTTQVAEELGGSGVQAEVIIGRPEAVRDQLEPVGAELGRLGLEAQAVTWAFQRQVGEDWFPRVELVATQGLVEGLRIRKDVGELDRLRGAATIADAALGAVLPLLRDGPTEAEFGLALDSEMRRRGASGVSFETIVASGPNGAKPHARPSGRRIGPGELVVLDFGALLGGYHSDMSRTVCVGEPTDPLARRMVQAVFEAQAAGVAAVRAGREASEVDRACRDVIAFYGWADAFIHGTGHGVGLDIHEAPGVNAASVATLEPGYVVTVEPGVYLPDHGGVRIEDTVVVTPLGCAPLTHAPKDLIVT